MRSRPSPPPPEGRPNLTLDVRLSRVWLAGAVAVGLLTGAGLLATGAGGHDHASAAGGRSVAPGSAVPTRASATTPTPTAATTPTATPAITPAPAPSATGPVRQTVHRSTYRAAGRVSVAPRVKMRAWAVADMDTGALLVVHGARRLLPQASTIKLLTAVTAAERVRPYPRHRVTRAEVHPAYCTCVGLHRGRRYSRAALLTGMLLPSANDAAEAMAGSDPHGHAAFIDAMNAKAAALGATDTHVVTPSGLSAPGAHSSARDLLVLLRAAQANPVVEPFLEASTGLVGPLHGRAHTVYRSTDYVNEYPLAQGKSGYTTPALNTLVVATPMRTSDGSVRRIGVATLGAPGGHSTSGTRALTVWAARNFARLRPLGHLPPAPGPVVGAQADLNPAG